VAHIAVGRPEEMSGEFTTSGELYYACLVLGHIDAGMSGHIVVEYGEQKRP